MKRFKLNHFFSQPRSFTLIIPWVLLLLTLASSVFIWEQQEQIIENTLQLQLDKEIQRTLTQLTTRLNSYDDALRGAQGLLATSSENGIHRVDWYHYVNSLSIEQRFPGIYGLGYIAYVPHSELDNFLQVTRSDKAPDYTYKPSGDRDDYFIIKFIEPLEKNLPALGYDVGSEPVRREGAERARDTGQSTITGKIVLVQDTNKQPGFLFYLPVYQPGMPVSTVAERRAALKGWVYEPFRASDLLETNSTSFISRPSVVTTPTGSVESTMSKAFNSQVDLEIFDGTMPSRETLLYDSDNILHGFDDNKLFKRELQLQVGGRTWTLRFTTLPAFDAASNRSGALIWLMAGLCLSLGLFAFTWGLAKTRSTALKLANSTLQTVEESQVRFRSLFEASFEGLCIHDSSGQIIEVNQAFENLFSCNAEEARHKHLSDFIDTYEHPALHSVGRLGSEQSSVILMGKRKDGTTFDLEVVHKAHIYQGRRVQVTALRNITERKKAEEALRLSEMRLSGIINSATDAIITLDNEYHIIVFNRAAEEMFGCTFEEALGQTVSRFIPERSRQIHKKHVQNFAEDSEAHSRVMNSAREITALRANGEEFPIEATISQVETEAQKLFTIIIRDITERRNAEKALAEARDQALESSRLKSQFLANMSHEIRTPLSSVIGLSGLLADTPLNHEQREYTEIIDNSAKALLELLNDILDFSKIEADKLTLEITDFDLLKLVEESTDLLVIKAHEKGLALLSYVEPELGRYWKGDPNRIRQVLTNLVGNAVKFTEKGQVIVKVILENEEGFNQADPTTEFEEEIEHKKTLIRFVISDSGIGLSRQTQQRLFQPFTQADGSTTRKYGGTGLGLSISKRLVELMGGKLGVESEEGHGSTFWFTIPLEVSSLQTNDDPGHPYLASEKNAGEILKGSRVLLVDDNPAHFQIMQNYLTIWGMHVERATSSLTALAMVKEARNNRRPYQVIILDLNPQEMTGLDLAGQLQNEDPFARIILVTAYDQKKQNKEAFQAESWGYLTKPIKQSQLFNCLISALSNDAMFNSSTGTQTLASCYTKKGNLGRNLAASTVLPQAGQFLFPNAVITREKNLMLEPDRTDHNCKPASETPPVFSNVSPTSKGLILLAEDNPVNQKIGLTQLRKLGYTAQGVSDGLEVLQMLSHRQGQNSYSLILMDCQMPHLDGFETTRAIRQQEKVMGNNQHIPIIALTANAMQGDREVCLAAGMDDYLTKPIVLEELEQRLEYWIKKAGASDQVSESNSDPVVKQVSKTQPAAAKETMVVRQAACTSAEELIDQKVLASLKKLQEVSGTPLLNQLIDLFLTDTPNRLAGMAKAIKEQDGHTLERIAHSLKGSCGNLGLKRMAPLCKTLEEAGKNGKTLEFSSTLAQLDREFQQVAALLQLIKTGETDQVEVATALQSNPQVTTASPITPPGKYGRHDDVVDFKNLQDLLELPDAAGQETPKTEELLTELVTMYSSDGEQLLARLEQALAEQDSDKFYQAAHTLKGSSSYLGAYKLARQCQELEALARAGIIHPAQPDILESLAQVKIQFEQVCQALLNWRSGSI